MFFKRSKIKSFFILGIVLSPPWVGVRSALACQVCDGDIGDPEDFQNQKKPKKSFYEPDNGNSAPPIPFKEFETSEIPGKKSPTKKDDQEQGSVVNKRVKLLKETQDPNGNSKKN